MESFERLTLTVVCIVVVAGIFLVCPAVKAAQNICPNKGNYEPCACSGEKAEYSVECQQVLINDVIRIFKRNKPSRIVVFSLNLSAHDASSNGITTIPNNLLQDHSVSFCRLNSPNNSYSLHIERKAFYFSRNLTEFFYLGTFDIGRLDFTFLTGFEKLSALELEHISNVHLANWTSLPPLKNLKSLTIHRSTGLNDWKIFPPLVFGLEYLNLQRNQIESEPMDRILNWIAGHSAKTLNSLVLSENDMTRIPPQILNFTNTIFHLLIDKQKTGFRSIPSGSFNFTCTFCIFNLNGNNISTIEPGAFNGSSGYVLADFSSNNLTRFGVRVFKKFLKEIASISSGGLNVLENPFDCERDPCHLAWLIRDNQDLLDHLAADCSNGTSFEHLNSNALSHFVIPTKTTKRPSNSSLRHRAYYYQITVMVTVTFIWLY